MYTPLAQSLTHSSFFRDWLRFTRGASDHRSAQTANLRRILERHPYLSSEEEFRRQKVDDYPSISKKLATSPQKVVRYQPTSGSGEKEKLIPYTQDFIAELNRALNPWLFDLCRQHPSVLSGKHYWSISWLPTHWRQKGWELDDFELLPPWKKSLTRSLMAVPNEVSRAASLSASQFATLAYLLSRNDLTFISVWSPTFMLQLLELVADWQEPIQRTLATGQWGSFADELRHLKAPRSRAQGQLLSDLDFRKIWPRLRLVSSWDSSTSGAWAKKLRSTLPHAKFQGKGLWATEGVLTIPFENKFVLSYLSHYYEFLDLTSGDLLRSHELREGLEVHPVLTCANGFTRYHLKDRVVVSGFYKSVPTLEFLERDSAIDMVGEKLDNHSFLNVHDLMQARFPALKWVVVFAVNAGDGKPRYHFVFEGTGCEVTTAEYLSQQLHEHFHYHLAAELGQLAPPAVTIIPDGFARYQHYQLKRGMVQGNIKVELASVIKTEKEWGFFYESFLKRT